MQSFPSISPLHELLQDAKEKIVTQRVEHPVLQDNNLVWDVLRTDLVHPVCSGNKLFKLYHYLADAIQKNHTTVSTFGGAWSNHLVATAYAASICGLRSRGFVRGEVPANWSATLMDASRYGMELIFLPRQEFDRIALQEPALAEREYLIPMGGLGPMGIRGAAMMMDYAGPGYTHIACACGTGTMLAGLATASTQARIIGINTVKQPLPALQEPALAERCQVFDSYGFRGYGRSDHRLLAFINQFFEQNRIPTDFVYTAKLMFAIQDLAAKGYFPEGSRILAVHSGGLQGNKSLKKGELIF